MSMLSYFDFDPAFERAETDEIRLRDCAGMIAEGQVRVHIAGKDLGYEAFFRAAVESERYGALRMREYAELYRVEPPLQFSAVTFRGPSFSFIAYRGTDDTLAGWKEDFMIGSTVTEAQELARDYALRNITGEGDWYIGGHSKGGNLALYAACSLPEEQWAMIRRVYLLDGPGLCAEVMGEDCVGRVASQTTRIVPQFSVIGGLFAPEIPDTRIIRSSASGILQHSLCSWGIDHGRLALAKESDPRSAWLNDLLARWIDGISQEDRVVFVNELFDALSAGGAETLDDIEDKGVGSFEAILVRLMSSSEITKKTIYDLPRRALYGGYYDEITRKGLGAWLWDRYLDKLSSKAEKGAEIGDDI
ncbi:MAG: DUF2974 domain-containing protein [Oscillospiraceae bacterium]|nr:DUF2974 domain-containing protein [Oscillospiraceae bacterium]